MTVSAWNPVNYRSVLTRFGYRSSIYTLPYNEKTLMFICEETLTCLFVISLKGIRLNVERTEVIQSENEVVNINGNDKYILMLDKYNNLFYLKGSINNISEQCNPLNSENFLGSHENFSWQRLQHIPNCLAVEAFVEGLVVLQHNQSVWITVSKSVELGGDSVQFSSENLIYFNPDGMYFIKKLVSKLDKMIHEKIVKGLTAESEILIILMPSQILFISPTPQGVFKSQSYSVSLQGEQIIDVLEFPKTLSMMIVCKSGKIIILQFTADTLTFQTNYIWLPNKLCTIVGYEEENNIMLLWSDLNDLFISKRIDSKELVHNIFHDYNIKGVRHLIKINHNLVAVTKNACFYDMKVDMMKGTKNTSDIRLSSDDILNTMYKMSLRMKVCSGDIRHMESLLKAVEISKAPAVSSNIFVNVKKNTIVIENKTTHLFQNELWKVKLEIYDYVHCRCVEIRKLEADLIPYGSVSILYNSTQKYILNVTLICDSVNDYVICFDLFSNKARDTNSLKESAEINNFKLFLSQHL